MATKLYEAGYRKVADDEIIIKKSKIGMLEKTIDYLEIEKAQLNKQLEKAKKETAREILQEILYTKSCEEWFENEQLVDFGKKIVDKIENLANKYGIELE